MAEVDSNGVQLYSRHQRSLKFQFPPIVESLEKLGHEAVLDGEIVMIDEAGKPHFELLQNYLRVGKGHLIYYVFDLLYLDGHDLRGLPLVRRKALLRHILGSLPHVAFSDHIEANGKAFFDLIAQSSVEGIIAKDGSSPYLAGKRTRYWLKIKSYLYQEAVVGGFTEPQGSRRHFGALLLGVYEADELVYVGHVGGGFSQRQLAEIRARLEPLIQEACPFKKRPKANAPAHWVKPQLVCQVRFQEWTTDGYLRHPICVSIRERKSSRSIHRQKLRRTKP